MNSSIQIHFSEENKPVIRVTEMTPKNGPAQDVRDVLVQRLREGLKSTSTTFTIHLSNNVQPDYFQYEISPVADELTYFEQRILELSPFGQFPKGDNAKMIRTFFDNLRKVSLGDHNPEGLKKFNDWNPSGLNGMVQPNV